MSPSFIKGPLMMIISSLLFAVMAYYAKLAAIRIPGPEVALIRFAFGIGVGLVLAACKRIDLRTSNKKLLVVRGAFGGIAILLYFLALAKGNMTNATILNNSYPIFSTLIAALYLQEQLTGAIGASLVISWLGVGLLIHPDFHYMFGGGGAGWHFLQSSWPDLLALLSGVLGGFAVAVVRELRRNNEPAWNVLFYLSIFGFLTSICFAVPVWVWPDGWSAFYLLATAAFGLIAQLAMTYSYKYCNTAIGGVLSMTTMLFAALIGYFGFAERLNAGETWGAILIGVGSVLVVWLNDSGRANQKTAAPPLS